MLLTVIYIDISYPSSSTYDFMCDLMDFYHLVQLTSIKSVCLFDALCFWILTSLGRCPGA